MRSGVCVGLLVRRAWRGGRRGSTVVVGVRNRRSLVAEAKSRTLLVVDLSRKIRAVVDSSRTSLVVVAVARGAVTSVPRLELWGMVVVVVARDSVRIARGGCMLLSGGSRRTTS